MSLFNENDNITKKAKEFRWNLHEKVGKLKIKFRRFLGLDCFFKVMLYYNGEEVSDDTTLRNIEFNPQKEKLEIYLLKEGEVFCIDN